MPNRIWISALLVWMASGSIAFCRNDFPKNDKVDILFEELFLGESVYPQEKGAIQFTTGFFQNAKYKNEYVLPVILEYGITDEFQVAMGIPVEFKRPNGYADGVGNVWMDAYWTFINDGKAGLACGTGCSIGLPTATPDVGDKAMIYEPYFIALREVNDIYFNASLGVEIKSPIDRDEETEVEGFLALAVFRQWNDFVPLLEFSVLMEEDETQLRLAPGMYWKPKWSKAEFGVSLPIGLNSDTPNIGVWFLSTVEYETIKKHDTADDDD